MRVFKNYLGKVLLYELAYYSMNYNGFLQQPLASPGFAKCQAVYP